jgi:hypothetical protein
VEWSEHLLQSGDHVCRDGERGAHGKAHEGFVLDGPDWQLHLERKRNQ